MNPEISGISVRRPTRNSARSRWRRKEGGRGVAAKRDRVVSGSGSGPGWTVRVKGGGALLGFGLRLGPGSRPAREPRAVGTGPRGNGYGGGVECWA